LSDKAGMQTRISFTSAQMERVDIARAYRRTHLEFELLAKLGLMPVDAATGEAAAAGSAAAAAIALAGKDEVDGRGGPAEDGGAVLEGGGEGENGGDGLGGQADAEYPDERNELPIVEEDEAIENLSTEKLETVVRNALKSLRASPPMDPTVHPNGPV